MNPGEGAAWQGLESILPIQQSCSGQIFRKTWRMGVLLLLGCLCSCATHPSHSLTVIMNEKAGRGANIIVMLRLGDGKPLPFILDTGATTTVLDASLISQLGPRLETKTAVFFGKEHEVGIYTAPKLCLNGQALKASGSPIGALDLSKVISTTNGPVKGILGMDYLGQYCLQLDFAAKQVRLGITPINRKSSLGTPFHLVRSEDGCFTTDQSLIGGGGTPSLIDTGCNYDGWLIPDAYSKWTNKTASGPHSSDGVFGAESYPELDVRGLEQELFSSRDGHLKVNGIGLTFLARHRVILDFPGNTMYLKRTTTNSLQKEHLQIEARRAAEAVMKILTHMKTNGQLPGWSKDDAWGHREEHFNYTYPDSITCDHVLKKGHAEFYHYTFRRSSESGWEMVKAWRTDAGDRVVEEYPSPSAAPNAK